MIWWSLVALEPPDGGWSVPRIHLIEAQVLLLAVPLPQTRARWIAFLPLTNPITCETAFGDHHVHMIRHQMTCPHLALLLHRQFAKNVPEMPPQLSGDRA
jgi:hypothetical protein